MPRDRRELEQIERQILAPFAQFSGDTHGRKYSEPPPQWRTQYQRDRDRVIHSRAFRRLEYKTQVFLNGTGDHLRTRLTHTIEVAAMARNIARALGLNEDLAETIALAHDLGHSPFGHKGEAVLNQPFSFGFLKAWEAMRVMSPDTCRPFSKDRRGLILGEGGAMLILEPFAAARARSARIHAEVVGFGMSSDAHHLTHLTIDGPVRAMRAALRDARLLPEQVGYINAHGSGTQINDPMETRAIRETFGAHADRLAVSSTKSLHGHTLGATGAMEALCTVLALKNGLLPPTANFTVPDPDCNLDVVPNRARPAQVEFALSNSFAFGGLNAVLAFRKA